MYMEDEILEQPDAVKRCLAKNRQKAMELAAAAASVRHIVIVARGSSDNAGMYGRYLFEMVTGKPVSMAACSVVTAYGAPIDYSGCLVIGLSQSGAAEDVRALLARAGECGALTAAITNDPASPVACAAGMHFDLCAGVEKSVAATKTVCNEMLVLALMAGYMGKCDRLISALSKLPASLREVFGMRAGIAAAAAAFRFAEDCVVLSRGLCYTTALEMSLKLQETSYTNARGMSIADFAHGPLAMIQQNTPVIIIVPSDQARPSVIEGGKRISALGGSILAIEQEKSGLSDTSLQLPATDTLVSPFVFLAAAQLFALELTTVRGMNPDVPRNIRKVTVTV